VLEVLPVDAVLIVCCLDRAGLLLSVDGGLIALHRLVIPATAVVAFAALVRLALALVGLGAIYPLE